MRGLITASSCISIDLGADSYKHSFSYVGSECNLGRLTAISSACLSARVEVYRMCTVVPSVAFARKPFESSLTISTSPPPHWPSQNSCLSRWSASMTIVASGQLQPRTAHIQLQWVVMVTNRLLALRFQPHRVSNSIDERRHTLTNPHNDA